MKRFSVIAVSVALILFSAQLAFAQSGEELKALKDEIRALKEGQNAIQKDLQEIKKQLRARQVPPQAPADFKETVVSIGSSPVKGEKDAKLVLMEFSDYQ